MLLLLLRRLYVESVQPIKVQFRPGMAFGYGYAHICKLVIAWSAHCCGKQDCRGIPAGMRLVLIVIMTEVEIKLSAIAPVAGAESATCRPYPVNLRRSPLTGWKCKDVNS